jgi:hypothetical protein
MDETKKGLLGLVWVVLLFLIVASAFLLLYDFPKKFEIEYPAMEYREGDPASGQATTIKIKGTLTRPILSDPTFHGQFIIDKYEMTKTFDVIDIVFSKEMTDGVGALSYNFTKNGEVDLQMFGAIWISDNFDQLTILVNEPIGGERKTAKNLRISAPAKTYDEAMLVNKLLTD